MSTFPLQIGTPDGLLFEGDVTRVVCRSITGDLAILAGHCNFCTALGMGEAHVVMEDGTRRDAACIGGIEVLQATWLFWQVTVISVRLLVWARLMLLWRTEPVGTRHVSAECFPSWTENAVFLQLPGNGQKILISKEQN